MKRLLMVLMALIFTTTAAFAGTTKTYGIHLFFNEQEFVDVLILNTNENGDIAGEMKVPNDFDAKVDNLVVSSQRITFDLLVPKNSSRPKDLIFQYEGNFFDLNQREIAGFVKIQGEAGFVASFVGFLRD